MKFVQNRFAQITILCAILLGLIYGLYFFFAPGNTLYMPCSKILYYDADKLTEYADLIVTGSPEKEFSEYSPTITYNNAGRYESFYTLTDFKVLKVIKGDKTLKSISVMQCASYINNSPLSKLQKDLMVLDDYSVMEKNLKYLLFLKKSDNGSYSIVSVNQGKFNIDNLDKNEKDIAENDDQYNKLTKNVFVKFKDEIDEYQNGHVGSAKETGPVNLYQTEDEWIDKRKDSSDLLDQALLNWLKNKKLNAFKSYYSSDEDATFSKIIELGIKYLPEMVNRIKADDGVQTGVLMDAVSQITKIDSLRKIDLSAEGKRQWLLSYENALQKASLIVDSISDDESLKTGIKECGIFSAPYIAEQESFRNVDSLFGTINLTADELKILKDMVEQKTK